jgi:hypothetical protein
MKLKSMFAEPEVTWTQVCRDSSTAPHARSTARETCAACEELRSCHGGRSLPDLQKRAGRRMCWSTGETERENSSFGNVIAQCANVIECR